MTNDRRQIPESENRLLILYTLRALGPVTDNQLLQLLAGAGLMNYIELQLSLGEMREQGTVTEITGSGETLLIPGDSGLQMLDQFLYRIPASRRSAVDGAAVRMRGGFRLERQAPAERFPLENGGECLRMQLLEEDGSLLMTVLLSMGSVPDRFRQRWCRCAARVYERVTGALASGTVTGEDAPLPENTSLETAGEGEWILSLTGVQGLPSVSLTLSLPDEMLARGFAAGWESVSGAMAEEISGMLWEADPS